jgi:hypothetical protein
MLLDFFFIVMLGGGTLWYLQKLFQYFKYIMLEFTPSIMLLDVENALVSDTDENPCLMV